MEDKILKSRRQVLTAVGVGVASALAGCSGNGSDGESDSTPEEENQPESETQTEQSTDTASTPEQEQTETNDQDTGQPEDTVHQGEEELEEFLSDGEILPDYQWIEFENPQDQINSPVESGLGEDSQFNYLLENGSYRLSQAGSDYEIDGMYLARSPDATGEEALAVFAFNEELWDEEDDFVVNFRDTVYGLREIGSTEDLETLLSEDVQAYNDVSEEFPQEYLDLVDQ